MDNDTIKNIVKGSIAVISLYAFCKTYSKLSSIEEKLSASIINHNGQVPNQSSGRPVRVFIDGVFDLTHYGHFNAIRQAATYGELYVGLDSQEETERNKGPTILTYDERKIMVGHLRWVSKLIENAPYSMTNEFLEILFTKYNIDYVMHGDDPCSVNGVDCYSVAKAMGKFKYIKRTEGISTTDLIGRMLSLSSDNSDLYIKSMSMLPTIRRLSLFVGGIPRSPPQGQTVILAVGSFDMLHSGHVLFLQKVKSFGDYLYVGIHDDHTVRTIRGPGYPILNIHERALSLLAYKYVDDVILGCPWIITKDLIASLGVTLVISGTMQEYQGDNPSFSTTEQFKAPKDMGIYMELDSPNNITTSDIVKRVLANNETLKLKYEKKLAKEQDYYHNEMGKIQEQ